MDELIPSIHGIFFFCRHHGSNFIITKKDPSSNKTQGFPTEAYLHISYNFKALV